MELENIHGLTEKYIQKDDKKLERYKSLVRDENKQ